MQALISMSSHGSTLPEGVAMHLTQAKAAAQILSSGKFKPSAGGWLGPGLYAHTRHGKEGKGNTPVYFRYDSLRLSDGSKPEGISQSRWETLARKPASAINKELEKLGYSGIIDDSKGWLLIFPSAVSMITPMRSSTSGADDEIHAKALEQTGYWGSAGAGCLVVSKNTGRLLLQLRSKYVEQPNTWGTWGGAIDIGEPPIKAALRELREETHVNVVPSAVRELFVYRDGSFKYTTFLVVVGPEFKPRLTEFGEVAAAKWFAANRLPSPLHFGLKAILSDKKAQSILKTFINRS